MKSRNSHICLASVSVAALCVGTDAWSQSASGTSPSAGKLEEIVVTAERRPERLQTVPIAITAITAESLKKTGVMSSQDLNSAVPGLNFTSLSNAAVIFIRGVGTTNPVVGNESSVPVYIDGVYQPSFKGDIFSFNNIDRVEVLKGPQGTLFGRNATGGAIQVVTKDPSATFSADLGIGAESYDTVIGRAYVTGEVAKNLAADFAAYVREQNGTLGTNTTNGDAIGTDREQSYRTKWRWTPDDLTVVTASLQYMQSGGSEGYNYQTYPGTKGFLGLSSYDGNPFDTHASFDPTGLVKQHAESLRIEHSFDNFRLVSITANSGTRSYYAYDPDQTPVNFEYAALPSSENAQSQELQLLSNQDSKLKWIFGAYYFRDVAKFPLTITGAALTPLTYLHRNSRGEVNSYSLFGQATYPIFTDTKLTLGGRFNWDDLGYTGTETSNFGTLVPTTTDGNYHKQPSYRIALNHNFTPDLMVYLSYNLGYKSGTFNLIDVPTEAATKPEVLRAYETGIKSEFFNRRLRLNGAAFYYDYKNLQVLVNEGAIAVESNAPAAEIYGIDGDAEAELNENLLARVGLSVLHDEFTNYPNAAYYSANPAGGTFTLTGANCPAGHAANGSGCSANGNHLPRVPNWTVDFGLTYDMPLTKGDLNFTVDDYINGGFYWEADNYVKQKSYNTLSADVTWRLPNDRWSIRFYGRNLTNSHYYDDVQENTFGFFGNVVHPMTIGGEVDYKY